MLNGLRVNARGGNAASFLEEEEMRPRLESLCHLLRSFCDERIFEEEECCVKTDNVWLALTVA